MVTPNHQIFINNSIVEKSFRTALKQKGNFFNNLRLAFTYEIETIFENYGVHVYSGKTLAHANLEKNRYFYEENIVTKYTGSKSDKKVLIDARFCSKYGHNHYSIDALNYIDNQFRKLPSLLPFKQIENYFLGNIAILVENRDYTVSLEIEEGLNITGYTFDISSRKRKSYICLLGIHFNNELLSPIFEQNLDHCTHPRDSLDQIRLDNAFFPVTFICRQCGEVLICSCFEEFMTIDNGLMVKRKDIKVKSNICHLCTGDIPTQTYPCSPAPSTFLLRYMPYHHLIALRKHGKFIFDHDPQFKPIENEVRGLFGYPQIGEKWITETILYKIVQVIFPSLEVVHHYRGRELEGLEIDIWIPDLKVAIEYQGIQHFEVVEHWGGKEGLTKRLQNDRKKKKLCSALEYKLVEFFHNEHLTEEVVTRRLRQSGIEPIQKC